jgi:hypothetical protein
MQDLHAPSMMLPVPAPAAGRVSACPHPVGTTAKKTTKTV